MILDYWLNQNRKNMKIQQQIKKLEQRKKFLQSEVNASGHNDGYIVQGFKEELERINNQITNLKRK